MHKFLEKKKEPTKQLFYVVHSKLNQMNKKNIDLQDQIMYVIVFTLIYVNIIRKHLFSKNYVLQKCQHNISIVKSF